MGMTRLLHSRRPYAIRGLASQSGQTQAFSAAKGQGPVGLRPEVQLFLTRLEDRRMLAGIYSFDAPTFNSAEGDATNVVHAVTITRTDTTAAEDVTVAVADAGATVGVDFRAGPVLVSFGLREANKVVPIQLLGDQTVELDEDINLSMTLFSGTGTAVGAAKSDRGLHDPE